MKKCTLFFILVGITAFSMAQDPLFTQKTGNINHFNPALVGAQSDFGVQANYNNQWPTLPLNPITSSLLTNYNLKNGLGFGLEVKSESVGSTRSDALKANINHAFSKNGFELRSGLNIGVLQNSIDVTKLNFRDPNDPILNEIKKHNPKRGVSLDIGAAAYYKGFLLGLAIQQLNEPDISFFSNTSIQPMRFGGNLAYIKEFNQFNLAGLATYQQDGKYSIIETQVFGQYKFVKLGLGYHQRFGSFGDSDIFSAAFGIQFDKFSVGYSYDDDFSNISRASSAGTHQATAAWYIKRLNKERGMSRLMNVLL
ncbi:MAG: type IX secretion system PorP/SprF family membrane protein [Flavobacteriales bacterium]|jgi:type IX secretion system PorP/SprF family membrane protein